MCERPQPDIAHPTSHRRMNWPSDRRSRTTRLPMMGRATCRGRHRICTCSADLVPRAGVMGGEPAVSALQQVGVIPRSAQPCWIQAHHTTASVLTRSPEVGST